MNDANDPTPPSDAIVTIPDLTAARDEIHQSSPQDASNALAEIEPELCGFMMASIQCLAGRLLLAGVDPALARMTAEDALGSVMTCIQALRRAQRRLWDSMDDAQAPPDSQTNDEAEDLSF